MHRADPLIAVAIGSARLAADDDRTAKGLAAAKATYQKDVEAYRKAVGEWLDRWEEAARKDGDKKLVDQIKAERKELPKAAPASLRQKLTAANTAMEAAYRAAVKGYTQAKMDTEASAVEQELENFKKGGSAPPKSPAAAADRRTNLAIPPSTLLSKLTGRASYDQKSGVRNEFAIWRQSAAWGSKSHSLRSGRGSTRSHVRVSPAPPRPAPGAAGGRGHGRPRNRIAGHAGPPDTVSAGGRPITAGSPRRRLDRTPAAWSTRLGPASHRMADSISVGCSLPRHSAPVTGRLTSGPNTRVRSRGRRAGPAAGSAGPFNPPRTPSSGGTRRPRGGRAAGTRPPPPG